MTKNNQPSKGLFGRWLIPHSGTGFNALVIVALVVALSLGLASLWHRYQPLAVAMQRVSSETIVINSPPPWIVTDIKQEAIAAGSLDGARLSDDDLTLRVAEAFRMHSWISKVARVSKKFPDSVQVQLEYRRPVAMVEVRNGNQAGLFPVDVEGTLLPTADFTAERAKSYPRISVPDAFPLGAPGSPWGDDRIHQAAVIAASLLPYWDRLELYRIVLLTGIDKSRYKTDSVFRLTTRTNVNIIWGHAPGKELPGEATADKKIARLLSLREQNGFDGVGPEQAIDLRNPEKIDMAALPAEFR